MSLGGELLLFSHVHEVHDVHDQPPHLTRLVSDLGLRTETQGPSGAKARLFAEFGGTAEAVPLQNG